MREAPLPTQTYTAGSSTLALASRMNASSDESEDASAGETCSNATSPEASESRKRALGAEAADEEGAEGTVESPSSDRKRPALGPCSSIREDYQHGPRSDDRAAHRRRSSRTGSGVR